MGPPANDDFDDDEFGEEEAAEHPRLQLVLRFAAYVRRVSWFASLGDPLSPSEIADAEAYCAELGFPHAAVVPVESWEDAEAAIRNPDWNSEWWEAEEALRANLIAEAAAEAPEEDILAALTAVTARASDVVHGQAAVAAARAGIADEALIRAAAGAATQACYQAALVLAAGAGDDHPFAVKFRLYEAGRWPLGIVGATFGVF
ncbi:hypothetical protein [Desertibaculum subflavum]|uniref:hypothetical protein n=1 Tax=Desertibaculum subflavum TaxID=2268458 RepID=UPI000E663450